MLEADAGTVPVAQREPGMAVITIAREYGAGGSDVARMLARELGAEIVDKSLIAEIARRASLPAQTVEQEEERGRSLFDRLLRLFAPLGDSTLGVVADPIDFVDPHDLIVQLTRAALQEAARSLNAVIVGRGGAVELRDRPNAFHVYLWAPLPDRVRVIRERLDCDEQTAGRRIHETDAARSRYLREVYGVDWRERSLYDLILNTGRLGTTGAAASILGALASRREAERARPATTDPAAP